MRLLLPTPPLGVPALLALRALLPLLVFLWIAAPPSTQARPTHAATADTTLTLLNGHPANPSLPPIKGLPVLTEVASVRHLSVAQAGRGFPVRLRGVVTYFQQGLPQQGPYLFLQDHTAGIFVLLTGSAPPMEPGHLIEIDGFSAPGEFVPIVRGESVQVVGEGVMPHPSTRSAERLFTGLEDSQWVHVECVIRHVSSYDTHHALLEASAGARRLQILVPIEKGGPLPNHLIDARVRVEGVSATLFNNHRQLIGVRLFAPGLQHVNILDPGSEAPYTIPVRPIDTLLQFSYDQEIDRRVLVKGVVTLQRAGYLLYIQDETGGLLVQAREATTFMRPGDIVEVLGYAATGPFGPVMQDAVFRRLGTTPPPSPATTTPVEIQRAVKEAELVQVEARLLDVTRRGDDVMLTLASEEASFEALLPLPPGASQKLPYPEGVRLRLVGVTQLINTPLHPVSDPTTSALVPQGVRLLLRGPADVTLLEQAAWLTPSLFRLLFGGVGLVILLALGWALLLHRRVARQNQTIRQQLTEAESLRQEAQTANQAKSAYLAMMSHEIRTPMSGVIGMTSLLMDTPLSNQQRESLDIIRTSGDALLHIINQILDFSKVEAGHLTLDPHPFNLHDCLEDAIGLFIPQAAAAQVSLSLVADPSLPSYLNADATRLRQVLVNLLGNALKFTSEGEVVLTVRHETAGPGRYRLCVDVRDTGIGIPEEKQSGLFEPFRQADPTTSRRYGGTGLGLAITKRIVEMMDGTITVSSQPGAGTTFSFTIEGDEVAEQDQLRPSTARLAGLRVLIVEDHPTSALVAQHITQAWGMIPEVVDSGIAALDRIVDTSSYDLALLDYHLPDLDGLTLAHQIHRINPGMPLVMVSGSPPPDDARQEVLGAWINKPLRRNQLLRTLLAELDGPPPPAVQQAPSRAPDRAARAANTRPLRILLTDDDKVSRKVTQRMLERLGYRADLAEHGRAAVNALDENFYDVVLMDVLMPEMDGLEATRHLRRTLPPSRQPVIVALTAGTTQEEQEACFAAGMDMYLSKPLRLDTLEALLRSISHRVTIRTDQGHRLHRAG